MVFNEIKMKRNFINTMNVKDYPIERAQLVKDILQVFSYLFKIIFLVRKFLWIQ